jgi:hypothetical protein
VKVPTVSGLCALRGTIDDEASRMTSPATAVRSIARLVVEEVEPASRSSVTGWKSEGRPALLNPAARFGTGARSEMKLPSPRSFQR